MYTHSLTVTYLYYTVTLIYTTVAHSNIYIHCLYTISLPLCVVSRAPHSLAQRALIGEYKNNPLHAHRQYREPYNRAAIEPKRAQKKKSRR